MNRALSLDSGQEFQTFVIWILGFVIYHLMILKQLTLTNFRNYASRTFTFSPQTTLIVGPNAVGKTNVLEAIYLLSRGETMRASLGEELVEFRKDWARVEAELTDDMVGSKQKEDIGVDFSVSEEVAELEKEREKLEVFVGKNGNGGHKKVFKVSGVEKSQEEFQFQFRVVLFSPQSLRLILGSPSRRRSYLNRVLSSVDFSYYHQQKEYKDVVRNRNKVLWKINEFGTARKELHYWDKKLYSLGQHITEDRKDLIQDLNEELENLGWEIQLFYESSSLEKELYRERVEQEIERTTTLWGPHRDNLRFIQINTNGESSRMGTNRDLAVYGSRGEQREAVFALCLAELEVVSERAGERPIFILDDIFSELDSEHRKRILEVLPRQQSIITSAEPELVNSGLMDTAKIIELR